MVRRCSKRVSPVLTINYTNYVHRSYVVRYNLKLAQVVANCTHSPYHVLIIANMELLSDYKSVGRVDKNKSEWVSDSVQIHPLLLLLGTHNNRYLGPPVEDHLGWLSSSFSSNQTPGWLEASSWSRWRLCDNNCVYEWMKPRSSRLLLFPKGNVMIGIQVDSYSYQRMYVSLYIVLNKQIRIRGTIHLFRNLRKIFDRIMKNWQIKQKPTK